MAYREVRRMDIDQVIRRWLAGENIRAAARSTDSDRNTVRRIVRLGEEAGIGRKDIEVSRRLSFEQLSSIWFW